MAPFGKVIFNDENKKERDDGNESENKSHSRFTKPKVGKRMGGMIFTSYKWRLLFPQAVDNDGCGIYDRH